MVAPYEVGQGRGQIRWVTGTPLHPSGDVGALLALGPQAAGWQLSENAGGEFECLHLLTRLQPAARLRMLISSVWVSSMGPPNVSELRNAPEEIRR